MNANWRTRQPINALVESGKRQKFSSTSSASGRSSAYNSPRSNSSASSISSIGSNSSGFSGRQSLSDLKRGIKRSIDPSDEARRHLSMRSHLPPLPYETFLGVDEFEDDLLSYTTEDIIGEGGQGKIVAGTVRSTITFLGLFNHFSAQTYISALSRPACGHQNFGRWRYLSRVSYCNEIFSSKRLETCWIQLY